MTASEQAKVARLTQMGFDESPALFALRQADGNVDAAVEVLLTNPPQPPAAAVDPARERRARAAAAAAEARMPASRPERRAPQQARIPSGGGSALNAQLEVACGTLCEFPAAVDTLLYVIATILENPSEPKFREIKRTNRRFRETVAPAGAAATRVLLLSGFQEAGDWFVLRGSADPARLWTAKAALEAAQNSPLYTLAKERAAFEDALKASLDSADEEEQRRRQRFASGVPTAPPEGAAGTTRVRVALGSGRVAQRAFHSDDVVNGVVSWLGAEHSSLVPDRLRSGEWELVDATMYPEKLVILDEMGERTLQAAGMWPGAELRVQPAGTLEAKEDAEKGLV